MSRRRTARKNAFLVLYQRDVTDRPIDEILERWRSYRGELDEFGYALVLGVEREREALAEEGERLLRFMTDGTGEFRFVEP